MKKFFTKKQLASVLIVFCSIIFLTSGLGKLFSMDYFSDIIKSFKVPSFTFIAPLISIIEIWLALALIIKYYIKIHILLSIFLVTFFTIIFSLGHFILGIKDCGCFGKISFLHFNPFTIFLRNIILIIILTFCYYNIQNSSISKLKSSLIIITIVIIFFITKFIFFNKRALSNPIKIYTYDLYKYDKQLTLNNDSTYLLFFYSPNCPKCINATENIKSFLEVGKVQKIIGITSKNRKVEIPKYEQQLNPNFSTIIVDRDSFVNVIKKLPYALIVKHGMVIWSCTGNNCNISPYLIDVK